MAVKERTLLSIYLDEIGKYEVLKRKEEKELFCLLAEGCKKSYNKFFNHNLKLVVKISLRFRGNNVDDLDLIQAGNFGLIRAIEKFDVKLGYKFSTYATPWIKQFILAEISKTCRTIRVPSNESSKAMRIKKKVEKYCNEKLVDVSGKDEILKEAQVTRKEFEKASFIKYISGSHDINATINTDSTSQLIEIISYDSIKTPEEEQDNNDIKKLLKKYLMSIDERKRRIISLRFDLNGSGKMTLQNISAMEGITRERVRQLEEMALGQLQKKISLDNLGELL